MGYYLFQSLTFRVLLKINYMQKPIVFPWFVIIPLILSVGSCSSERNRKADSILPNIVLILADDMGYGDVSCFNPMSKIQTPHIDKLALEGMMFTDAHSPSAVCTPSRYGLLTGRYCWRTRLKKGVILGYDEAPLIVSGQETIASLLKERGYTSACIGKWHVGLNWQTKDGYQMQDDNNQYQDYSGVYRKNEEHVDFEKEIRGGPLDVGFDYFFGTQGCSTGDPPYCFIENKKTLGIPTIPSPDEFTKHPGVAPGLMVPEWSSETVDVTFTEKAIAFIDKMQTESKADPFFLYLALSSPHIPFLPPDFAIGKSEEGGRGDLVTVVDWSVGQIVDVLNRYDIQDNTLLIVTSDNGPRRGANGHQSAGKFRGYKANIWEGGHRVPFIARWPGKIKAGAQSDQVLSLTDLLPTFDFISNEDKQVKAYEDAYNIWPAFIGEEVEEADEMVRIFHSALGIFAIRRDAWKLIQGTKGPGSGRFTVPQDSLKLIGQLYNLASDPGETKDLWNQYPELVQELTNILEERKNTR